jgi:dephospho-CoA kinase
MLLVGLTGGIGSGKSTVAGLLADRGAVVVDADQVARDVVEPGQPAFVKLVERFGNEIVGADGRLDRPKLAEIAFATEEATADLNAITHPAVGEEFLRRMTDVPADAIVVCDVPLLVESETARSRGYEFVIVVEAPRELRLERLEGRGVSRADAEARMSKQATDEERRAIATYVLDNSADRDYLETQVHNLWTELSAIAAERRAHPA